MAALLIEKGISKTMAYHGGLEQEQRILIQQQFIHDQLDVICATSAFGMGVNKENIRFVIHYHMPMQMESYLQEIGRAGRDGNSSIALLLYSPGDEQLPIQLAEGELPTEQQIDWLFAQLTFETQLNRKTLDALHYLRDQGGFSEIQWRIVQDFFNHGTEVPEQLNRMIKEFVTERLTAKKNNIFYFKKWILSNSCRREMVLNYFEEENSIEKIKFCCDRCGINLDPFQATGDTLSNLTYEGKWKDYLAKILLNSEWSGANEK
jgi:ATP-dependent DNA helicase RecQ